MIWVKKRLCLGFLVAAVLALAACGGAGGGAGGGSDGGSEEVRTVGHAMGEAEIEGTPGRVVVLDTGELDSAESLGVTPVGAVEAVEGLGLPSYLEGTGERITSDPLWRKLDAVREGRVYEVSDDLWMLGIGPTAAEGVVDDLERSLTGK